MTELSYSEYRGNFLSEPTETDLYHYRKRSVMS